MIQYFTYSCLLIACFYLLVKSSDYLINSASILGERAGFSKFIVGLTIVAIGTSLPELFTSLIGALTSENSASFVLGTIIGSNISNILFIFGLLLFFSYHFKVHIKYFDVIMLLISSLILFGIVMFGKISFWISLTLVLIYLLYMWKSIKTKRTSAFEEIEEVEKNVIAKLSTYLLVLILFISLIFLNLSAKGIVYSIENLGILLEIPIEYLTLTTVALATSLPEAVVTYTSAKEKQFDLALGNIIGSNISNILLICGIVGLVSQFSFDSFIYLKSIVIMLFVTFLFIITIFKKKLNKTIGIIYIIFYIIYILSTFIS